MVTASNARQEAGQLPELPSAESQAQSALRANSLPTALPVPAKGSDAASRAREFFERVAASLTGTSLLHSQPPSLHQSHTHHREAAQRWQAGLARWPRHLWGYLHLLIRTVLLGVDWVLAGPVRFAVTIAVLTVLWFWH